MNSNVKTLGLASGLAVALLTAAPAQELKLMTGPQGGSWVPLGGQLKDMWEKAVPGLSVQSLPGAGIANVRGIEEGKADIGFGNSISTVDALTGAEPFKKPHDNVCNIATLYPQYYQMVVLADSGVNSVKDLKGKAISTQPRGNTGEDDHRPAPEGLRPVLQRREDELRVLHRLGHADAGRPRAGLRPRHHDPGRRDHGPRVGARRSSCSTCPTRSTACASSIPATRWSRSRRAPIRSRSRTCKVIGYATHIVASCKLPEDTVYKMTKAIADNVSFARRRRQIDGDR